MRTKKFPFLLISLGIFFFLTIQTVHASITDIQINNTTINENSPSGTSIGTLSTIGGNPPYTYELTSGTGDNDNTLFTIENDQLKINFSPDYENPIDTGDTPNNNTYTTRVKAFDAYTEFTVEQNIATSGATVWEHFMIGTDHYIAVANNYNGTTYNINSVIYKWNGTSFVQEQTIATSGAADWEHFMIGTDHYLAVANYFNGTTYNINSVIYKWNGTSFVQEQTIATSGARDWQHFTIGVDHYLAVANSYNDTTNNINSVIYKWNGTSFVQEQVIGTNGAADWENFTIGTNQYLAVANHFNDSTFNINSAIYKWNGTSFIQQQTIPTSGARDWEHFTIGTDYYLAVANQYDGSTFITNSILYKWNGTSFVQEQMITTNAARDWEHFTIGTDHYLAIANQYNGVTYSLDSIIYKWSGISFVQEKTIATSGAVNWVGYTIGTDHYLAVANQYNGSTRNINSTIYKSTNDQFEKTFVITVNDVTENITITNPDQSKIQQAVTENYFSINNGTINATTEVSTNANITLETTQTQAIFPTTTTITETSNGTFNFQNFTLEPVSVKDEQPTSRNAFRLGIEGTNLTFSQPITIQATIGEAFNNQTLDILYQNEGETTWNTQGTCTVTNGTCTFQTDHATIYTINGIHQSEGDTPLNLNVEVQSTLSMDCYESTQGSGTYDVFLGTTSHPGTLTAGTPAIGQSTCEVTTNDTEGYYLTLEDNNPTHSTLTHTDPNTGTIYEISDLTQYVFTTPNTQTWNTPTTKGLGFSIISFPDTNLTNNTFNGIWTNTNQCPEGTNPDTNDYAGIPNTPQTIAAVTQYESGTTTTNICYKVDVPPSQPSGIYQGSVTYTATSDASSYLN